MAGESGRPAPGQRTARLRAVVHGYVQGVGYRYYVMQRARLLGIAGYVRNNTDGTVEVIAEGDQAPLEQLLEALERGPIGASVSYVDREWLPSHQQFYRFEVRA
ncbi:MAG: acylphosphatase [Anaerolineae bacterium]